MPSYYYGIEMQDCNNVIVKNNRFEGLDIGIEQRAKGFAALSPGSGEYYNSDFGNTNIKILNNHFEDVNARCINIGYGFAENVLVSGNTMQNGRFFCRATGQYMLTADAGSYYTLRTGKRTNNIVISNNIISNVVDSTVSAEYSGILVVEDFIEGVSVFGNSINGVDAGTPASGLPYLSINHGPFKNGPKEIAVWDNTFFGNLTKTALRVLNDNSGNIDVLDISIKGNSIQMDYKASGDTYGVFLESVNSGAIKTNKIDISENRFDFRNLVVGTGFSLASSNAGSNTNIVNITFKNNVCHNAVINGYKTKYLTLVNNCSIAVPADFGVTPNISLDGCDDTLIDNNYLSGGYNSINLINTDTAHITNNVMFNSYSNCINLGSGALDIDIEANVIKRSCQNGIAIAIIKSVGLKTINVNNNTFEGNSLTGFYVYHNNSVDTEPDTFQNNFVSNVERAFLTGSVKIGYITNLFGVDHETSLDDDAEVEIAPGRAGWGFVQLGDGEEYGFISFKSDGTVTLIQNSANTVNTDTDTKFCIYDKGTGIAIKNRLGSTKRLAYSIKYIKL